MTKKSHLVVQAKRKLDKGKKELIISSKDMPESTTEKGGILLIVAINKLYMAISTLHIVFAMGVVISFFETIEKTTNKKMKSVFFFF